MSKPYRILAAAAILFFIAAPVARAEIVDRIVAVVNDDVITLYELESTVEVILKRYEHNIRPEDRDRVAADARKAIVGRMINDLLLRQEARRLGITVREEEVTNTIQESLRKRNMSMDDLQQALAREGSTFDKYRDSTRNDLIRMRIMQREIRQRVSVTPEEIGAYYREHRGEYEGKLRVRLQMISLPVPANSGPQAKAEQREKAEAILKRIRGGEPFEALANETRQGAEPAGGDIGYVEKGTMHPSIDEVAFSLKPGEVSGVIETPQGFAILRALERRGGGSLSVKETREDVEDRLYRMKMEKKFEEWLAERRQKAHIEIRL
ncbi:MAG: Chaperone SurA precursor [Syntrophaceae bacterium PtaB.Bin038]|nr:MAG: Chaperone SurA precursor [Syntrophaceae bacterium PtaB.Bin038]